MATINKYGSAHDMLSAEIKRMVFRKCLLAMLLQATVLPAKAIPPPPPLAPQLRQAKMTVTVHLVDANNGQISKRTRLCEVSGKIPVYFDNGGPASFNPSDIVGCTMPKNRENLSVSVWGAKTISKSRGTFATAGVSVVPPYAVPNCPNLCGLQPLAESNAEVRVSGSARSMTFSLNPVVVSPGVPNFWFEADVEIVD